MLRVAAEKLHNCEGELANIADRSGHIGRWVGIIVCELHQNILSQQWVTSFLNSHSIFFASWETWRKTKSECCHPWYDEAATSTKRFKNNFNYHHPSSSLSVSPPCFILCHHQIFHSKLSFCWVKGQNRIKATLLCSRQHEPNVINRFGKNIVEPET